MIFQLTEEMVHAQCSDQSFARGLEYYRSGAVFHTARQGNVLMGECEGSSAPSYRLRVELDESGLRSAACTCPYDRGGICKHIVALLLAWIHTPEEFVERKDVNELLAGIDRDHLVKLVAKMVERDPEGYDWLETMLPAYDAAGEPATEGSQEKRKTPVSAKAYRRRIQRILRSLDGYSSSEAYWEVSGLVAQLDEIRDAACQLLDAGDAEGALAILTVLLEEVAGEYEQFDDSDGDLGAFLDDLGMPLAEAILSADLDDRERDRFTAQIGEVVDELADYGIDQIAVALAALKKGWREEEPAESDEATDEQDWDEYDEYDEDWEDERDLEIAKLNVLERQGRVGEYLARCQAVMEYRRYVLKLLELGRKDEAIRAAMKSLSTPDDALAVAQRLRELGDVPEALAVAERGLSLMGEKSALGAWLGPLEEAQQRPDQALKAYHIAFEGRPSLELYRSLQQLASQGWNHLKPQLVETLQVSHNLDVLADIALAEEDWDAAIHAAEQAVWNHELVEKVADAVIPHRPDWVIRVSLKRSDELIERTQSNLYPIAALWLARAKKAYQYKGQTGEWQAYIANLRATYNRRPALQRALAGL